jgi:hypothetical protein
MVLQNTFGTAYDRRDFAAKSRFFFRQRPSLPTGGGKGEKQAALMMQA